jgi:hypothetical protein
VGFLLQTYKRTLYTEGNSRASVCMLRAGSYSPAHQLLEPVSWLAYCPTLKMEATISSETSVDFQRTKRQYIAQDRTLCHCTDFDEIRPKPIYTQKEVSVQSM